MDRYFGGRGLSREQLQAKAEAAAFVGQLDGDPSHHSAAQPKSSRPNSACEWQGDPPEPELDDLAHPPPEKNQQPPRPMDACDWYGDEPEQYEDDLDQVCPPDSQARKSARPDNQAEEANSIQMPIPRPPKVKGIPEIIFPLDDHIGSDQNHDPITPSEPLVQDRKQSERAKRPRKKKPQAGDKAGPSNAPPIERGTANESPVQDKTHSPWVDSLEHMSTAVMDRVNMGVKQTLDAATNILTPSAHKTQSSSEPTRRTSGLAPPSAAPPPSDFFVPRATHPDTQGDGKKQERERARSEKKAQREAKRKARQEKSKERKKNRRERKERRRKEREAKRIAKKGGELPAHLLQGLRVASDLKIPYNPRCDVCTNSAAATMSSKKRNQKCTICAKQAERESTNQYLKSSKVNLAALPSEDLTGSIKKLLGKGGRTAGGDHEHADEELAQHIALHVQDFATSGGEASLHGHKCNNHGQPGHLGHHGLDRNRDSPTTTDGGQIVSTSYRNSELYAIPMPSEVDWWAQALSSEVPPSPYRSNSPPCAAPLLPR
ncbi:hypothetical protein F5Y10DRAFT_285048 [Nemania abortiva]|nr:hypothetical protein F5Y10DRAFT_285048 [Nemania abortiva]